MTARPRMEVCPECEKKTMKETMYEFSREACGMVFVGSIPSDSCDSCKGEYVWGPGMVAFDLVVALRLVENGIRNGTAHIFCRNSIALYREEAAELYGVDLDEVRRMEVPDASPDDVYWDLLVSKIKKELDDCILKPDVQMNQA